MARERQKGCQRLIAEQLDKTLDHLDDSLSDIDGLMDEFEMSSTLVRNVGGARRELHKAIKSCRAAAVIAQLEVDE